MSWRKFDNHKDETKAVKAALAKAGINAIVGHGRGTAWGWLHINIGRGQQFGEHDKHDKDSDRWSPCWPDCKPCREMKRMQDMALKIAKEVTGRHGEYDGDILIETQDHWSDKKGSQPIFHPNWKEEKPKREVPEAEKENEALHARAMASQYEQQASEIKDTAIAQKKIDLAQQWRDYAASCVCG